MINKRFFQTIQLLVIVIFIAIFGINSCSGADITGSDGSYAGEIITPDNGNNGSEPDSVGDSSTPDNGNNGFKPESGGDSSTPGNGENNSTPEVTYPNYTYRTVYAPHSGRNAEGEYNFIKISYQDTNTLAETWKNVIRRKGKTDGKIWYIRDGDNRHSDFRNGNYYYFDKNFDLVYYRQDKGSLRIRQFVGAVIMKYYRGTRGQNSGTFAIAGLYKNLIDRAGQYNWEHFSKFMHAGYNGGGNNNEYRKVGDLELLLINTGFYNQSQNEFGVDSYYNTWNEYRTDINKFLGQSPESFETSGTYAGRSRLNINERVNHSYNLNVYNFTFVDMSPYDWHLADHSKYSGWHK